MREICEKLEFPEDAICDILEAREKMSCDFKEQYKLFVSGKHDEAIAQLKTMAEECNISEYMANIVFLLWCVPYAEENFRKKNIDEKIFYDTMKNFTYKLYECKNTYGVWGIFGADWLTRHIKAELFALGRLQFEYVHFEHDYKDVLKKGDILLNCHIPSSGPLTPESVKSSLDKAYKFFNKTEDMYVMCHTWLFYPPYYELFGNNTRAFCDLFDIFYSNESDMEYWRIFSCEKFSDVNENDLKTSLQKRFYNYLKDGGKTGYGVGVLKYKTKNR